MYKYPDHLLQVSRRDRTSGSSIGVVAVVGGVLGGVLVLVLVVVASGNGVTDLLVPKIALV